MKLTCSSVDLQTHLSLSCRAVPSRPSHPILGNILLSACSDTQQIHLTAFNLSLGIKTRFLAHIETGGQVTIPAKLFQDIVSHLPEGDITVSVQPEAQETEDADPSWMITLTHASGRYQFKGTNPEDFPQLPAINGGHSLQIPTSSLSEGVQSSLVATSTDEAKQVLCGVHLTVQPDSLEFAATDGHRLAVAQTATQVTETETTDEAQAEPTQLTIPTKTLTELDRILSTSKPENPIALHYCQGQVIFDAQSAYLTSRTLEGQYPEYRALIPKKFKNHITVEKRQLLKALERIAILADPKNKVIRLTLDKKNQDVLLTTATENGTGQEVIPAQISGKDLEIAFNSQYLIEGLKVTKTSDIRLQINETHSPAILTPLGGQNLTYLLMPVQITG
ncbi:DNA polymerase III subunit beta [Coleofasciculus sp. E2-BRE-01]|uniref:DNA polymerase III subunit beta n=1 Tax=Coleofasciculus sp. E2-BRE-01 TaxID=3069524 RepID=UPI0033034CC5